MKAIKLEYIDVKKLIPYARNARTHSESQVKKIAASVKEFGFNNPVLIDKDNGIIAGHGRVMAAELLKLDSVPCVRLEHLTDTQNALTFWRIIVWLSCQGGMMKCLSLKWKT